MSDDTVRTIRFAFMVILLGVSCVSAFVSFLWLMFAAVSGMGLMPWLVVFPLSWLGAWFSAGKAGV